MTHTLYLIVDEATIILQDNVVGLRVHRDVITSHDDRDWYHIIATLLGLTLDNPAM